MMLIPSLLSVLAQASDEPTPFLNVSALMGRVVAGLVVLIIVVWIVKKARGKN